MNSNLHSTKSHQNTSAENDKIGMFVLMYQELISLAAALIANDYHSQEMQSWDLVHETYLKMIARGDLQYHDPDHFMRIAGKAMQCVIVDQKRKRMATKRGQGQTPLSLEDLWEEIPSPDDDECEYENIEALDGALEKLESHVAQRWGRIVLHLHFFVDLPFEKIAELLNLSKSKVVREWMMTRIWLRHQIDQS